MNDVDRFRRKKLRVGHVSERGAVNACRAIMERHGLVVHEVDGRADYGRDLLVDLVDEGEITGAVIGIQVKGDSRFIRQDGPWVLTASPTDVRFWAESTVPVFGVLWDPASQQMRYVNLTDHCRRPTALSHRESGLTIPVSSAFDDESLAEFTRAARTYVRQSAPTALLDLFGSDPGHAVAAVHDCFALGRADARALVLLRRSLLSLRGDALLTGIVVLSHAAPHPDIGWHEGNWVPEDICREVRKSFRWSATEVHHLIEAVESRVREGDVGWERGGLGQCLWHVLAEDQGLTNVATEAIGMFLAEGDSDAALRTLIVAQYSAPDPPKAVEEAISRFPDLRGHPYLNELLEDISQWGSIPVY